MHHRLYYVMYQAVEIVGKYGKIVSVLKLILHNKNIKTNEEAVHSALLFVGIRFGFDRSALRCDAFQCTSCTRMRQTYGTPGYFCAAVIGRVATKK